MLPCTRTLLVQCRILDNLPVGMVKWRTENGKDVKSYERGFPVGFKSAIEVRAPAHTFRQCIPRRSTLSPFKLVTLRGCHQRSRVHDDVPVSVPVWTVCHPEDDVPCWLLTTACQID